MTIKSVKAKKTKAKSTSKDCDHLNIVTRKINTVEMAICSDCNKAVDPEAYLPKESDPKPQSEEQQKDNIKKQKFYKVRELEVKTIIEEKGKIDPFYPVFKAQKGDIIVVYRKS